MITFLSILTLGFLLGMRHATDADHVVAVSTIVSREHSLREAALIGLIWGVGHSLTVVLVGGGIVVFGLIIPQRLGLGLEFTVAVMLVALGLWNLRALLGAMSEFAPAGTSHSHGFGLAHNHPDGPTLHTVDIISGRVARPLCVGVVHGLAGSAAVALMVLPLIRNPWWAAGYLFIFGAGTVAGMMLITSMIALPFRWSAQRPGLFHRRLGQLAATGSIGFGLFLMYDIGFIQGLFAR